MTRTGNSGDPAQSAPHYARLGVRLRAALYDSAILLVALVATIAIAHSAGSASNAIFVAGALMIFFYEPVLVAFRGSTLGHQLCNLRVVDDHRQTNPNLFKALVRFAIKSVLGLFSSLTIVTSMRLKAVHDFATGTSVQVRDAHRMRSIEFSGVGTVPVDMVLPSAMRRLAGIGIYAALSYVVLTVAMIALAEMGSISFECIDSDQCSPADTLTAGAAGLCWIAGLFSIVGLGWWGRLPGFRSKQVHKANDPRPQ